MSAPVSNDLTAHPEINEVRNPASPKSMHPHAWLDQLQLLQDRLKLNIQVLPSVDSPIFNRYDDRSVGPQWRRGMAFTGTKRKLLTEEADGSGAAFSQEWELRVGFGNEAVGVWR